MDDSDKSKEQLIAELAASRDEARSWRACFKAVPGQIYVWQRCNDDFVLIDHNHAAVDVTNGDISKLLGSKASELYKDQRQIIEGLEECFRGQCVVQQELTYAYKSTDAVRQLLFTCAFVPPDIVIVHADDITDRKLAEKKLADQASLLEQMQKAVISIDFNNTILSWNKHAEKLYQWTRHEAVGQNIIELLSPKELRGFVKRNLEALNRDGHWEGEFDVKRKDGTTIPAHIVNSYLKDINGENVGFIGISNDITEHKNLEEQLLQSQKMEAVGTLAGGVAHDMNNVLAVVLGLGSVLESEMGPDDPKTHDVREIISAARRGKSLVENLLGFARKGKYHKDRLSLNDTVRQLFEVLRHTIPKKIAISTALDDELAAVECDAAQMTQTLMNLCINASDALDGRGTMTISTSNAALDAGDVLGIEAGQYVKLQVKDDGPGMDEETQRKAFEPFFTTKDTGKGTGLGLSMAYSVIKNHGGVIQIDSSPGEGTAVNIWLPVAEAGEAQEVQEASRLDVNKRKVLLIDDEKMIRKMGKRMLEAAGYEVVVADGGNAALEIFKSRTDGFGLVLLDLSMPVMDGAECFEKLKEIDPSVRVLICTGHGSPGDIKKMVGDGVLGVVRKPFDLEQLSEAIDGAMCER